MALALLQDHFLEIFPLSSRVYVVCRFLACTLNLAPSQGPSALRNELAAAKKAVEVLKGEKDHTQNKLEKLHAVLEKERAALRDVLSAARKAVDDLKVTSHCDI